MQEGKSALHVAAEKGHLKVVDVLLTSNADPSAETTVSREPAIDLLSSLVEESVHFPFSSLENLFQMETGLEMNKIFLVKYKTRVEFNIWIEYKTSVEYKTEIAFLSSSLSLGSGDMLKLVWFWPLGSASKK